MPELAGRRAATAIALALGAYLAWGLLSPGNEILLAEMGPLWMQALRGVLALLVVTLWLRGGMQDAARALLRPGLPLALWIGNVAAFLLFAVAQTRIAPAHVTLGFFTAPLWTALVAWGMHRERPGPLFVPAAALMLVGGALVVGVRSVPVDGIGLALAVGSGVAWAFYAVLLAPHEEVPWRQLLAASMLLAAPFFLLVALLWEPMPDWGALSGRAWRWTMVQVAIPTLLAIGLYQSSLRRIDAGTANLFVGLELVGAVFWSWVLLGIPTGTTGLVGVLIVVAAVSGYLLHEHRRSLGAPSA